MGSLVVACKLLVVAHGLLSCGIRTLSCACMWDLVPWPGIEPRPPALGARSLIHCATRKVPTLFLGFPETLWHPSASLLQPYLVSLPWRTALRQIAWSRGLPSDPSLVCIKPRCLPYWILWGQTLARLPLTFQFIPCPVKHCLYFWNPPPIGPSDPRISCLLQVFLTWLCWVPTWFFQWQ